MLVLFLLKCPVDLLDERWLFAFYHKGDVVGVLFGMFVIYLSAGVPLGDAANVCIVCFSC